MASPIPKDPAKRARKNKDVAPVRYISPAFTVAKPDLPEIEVPIRPKDGEPYTVPFVWPERTRQWWEMLSHHPLVHEFFEADWEFLLDTARIHAEFWMGDTKLAGELRLREEKYGFTPADRAKMRIFNAQAIEGESRAADAVVKIESSRARMQGIRKAGA